MQRHHDYEPNNDFSKGMNFEAVGRIEKMLSEVKSELDKHIADSGPLHTEIALMKMEIETIKDNHKALKNSLTWVIRTAVGSVATALGVAVIAWVFRGV